MPFLFLLLLFLAAPVAAQTNAWHTPAQIAQTLELPPAQWADAALTYSNATRSVVFHADSRRLFIDGLLCYLNYPTRGHAVTGDWQVCSADIALLRDAYFPAPTDRQPPLHIVLDPGHGGTDPGTRATTRNLREKVLTLDIAQRLQLALTGTPHRVSLTRTGDETLALSNRVDFARRHEADLFISIHANNAPSTKAEGIETFALALEDAPGTNPGSTPRGPQPATPFNTASSALAYRLHRRLLDPAFYPHETPPADRGLKRAYFHVLRNAPCPAVLVEVGFLSNPAEAERLSRTAYIDALVAALRQGILDYATTPACHPQPPPCEKEIEKAAPEANISPPVSLPPSETEPPLENPKPSETP